MATKNQPAAKMTVRRALLDLPVSVDTPQNAADSQALDAVATDDIIMVNVPRAFTLTLDNGSPVPIRAGVQNLPRALAGHWYSKRNGVSEYNPDADSGQPA